MALTTDPIITRAKKIYHAAPRAEKCRLLTYLCVFYGCNRKYLTQILNSPSFKGAAPKKRGRRRIYTDAVHAVIIDFWKRMRYPCSKVLKAQLTNILSHYEERVQRLSDEIRAKVLAISPRTIDRILAAYRERNKPRGRSTTKSRKTPIKQLIPVRTEQYKITESGHIEGDLVSHCGGKAGEGQFYTLNTTDVGTQWFSARILKTKEASETLAAMKSIEHYLPFRLRGIDTDNGSEFINEEWVEEFLDRVQLTRSRPYKKNDNAHIEQKNYHHIRKHLAYGRFDSPAQFKLIDDLYKNDLSDFLNFFVPTHKLVAKERVGSKVRRKYDALKTPYQRVMESPLTPEEYKRILESKYERLDPFLLQKRIWDTIDKIYKLTPKATW